MGNKKREEGKQNAKCIDKQLKVSKEKSEKLSRKRKGKYINRWVWATRKYKTYDVDKVLKKVLDHFGNRSDILRDIKKELDAGISLEIVVEMNKNQTPAMIIDEKTIEFVKEIGGYIDIDIYVV